MQNLFNKKRPDANSVSKIKKLIMEHWSLPQTTQLAIAELRCQEHGCPPIETVITAYNSDGTRENWRIAKPVNYITLDDLEFLNKK